MKRKLERVNIVIIALIIIVMAAGAMASIYRLSNVDHNIYDNDFRVEISSDLQKIQEGQYAPARYPYIVLDLKGSVIATTTESYTIGQIVNLDEINSYDKYYASSNADHKKCFTLKKEDAVNGFVVFFVPESRFAKSQGAQDWLSIGLPLIVSFVSSILLCICYAFYVRRNVYRPVREISTSAKAIISGNYDMEVVRVYGERLSSNEVGDLIYSFELMRDELKEKQLKENELKLANQELISCISHDLRTPLSTIKAYAEGLRDGIATTKEEEKEYIGVIIKKTNLLVSMIKELLEYSNAQASRMGIEKKECYLHSYLLPVIKELRLFIEKKGILVETNITASDVIVKIDQKRITEVLYNLVENSMKYMDKENPKITINITDQKESVLVQVIDNGMGIDANDILYVFDKFYRAEKSRTSGVSGSGLGLSICQYIIKEHGGEIYCKSHVGKECEIGFTLPI